MKKFEQIMNVLMGLASLGAAAIYFYDAFKREKSSDELCEYTEDDLPY